MVSSPLGRLSPTEGNISPSPCVGQYDPTYTHTSALFSERCEFYGEEDRHTRVTSNTFSRLQVSFPLRIWHSSEILPPLTLPLASQRDTGVNTGSVYLL